MADTVQEVLQAFAKGELVVVTDDDDREGEGDLIVAASLCTAEKMAFIDHLHQKKAFAGVHSATDTEHDWAWYEDLVGEIYDGHVQGAPPSGTINIEASQKNHPAMAGIQSPWTRNEEWYRFDNRINTALPGVTILMRFGGPEAPLGATNGQPLAWTRDWEGIRSFYTALGHAESAYQEPLVRKHILGGILWAVGRLK